ncbi:hypothetical protein FA15DRAFT_627712 [Coprinopsis marcescibilis]|uniref:BTB domain-containing protein n=1 Tax=Coprinopsis marcescibilis TaxID=230819 RepID=A0A5C3KSC5_COPMA|nr:hypothetical protein FA15DRAFT_627712 [Coprinopsis marcescibilis]
MATGPPHPAIAKNTSFFWRNMHFKVEDEVFCVPLKEFVAASDSFEELVLKSELGGGDGSAEDCPVKIPGQSKVDFTALLKVLYPTASTLLSKNNAEIKLDLTKEEWIGVLKLSGLWGMTKIRDFALKNLSNVTLALSAIERIQLARSCCISNWLEDGIKALVQAERLDMDELKVLGWETVALLFCIRDTIARFSPSPTPTRFTLGSIKCVLCTGQACLIPLDPGEPTECPHCDRTLGRSSILCSADSTQGPNRKAGKVLLNSIRCPGTDHNPFSGETFTCRECKWDTREALQEFVRIEVSAPEFNILFDKYFGEEVERYEAL